MFNNPVTTFPTVAQKLRHLGNAYYPSVPVKPSLIPFQPNPNGMEFRYGWTSQANEEANTRVRSEQMSKNNYLKGKTRPESGHTRSGQPFGITQDMSKLPFNNEILIGGADVTYSSRMSNAERNKERINILNRLSSSLDAITEQVPSRQNYQLDQQQNTAIQALPAIEILLTSIQERVASGIIDGNVYRDFLDVLRFFNQNIQYYDNVFFFDNLITAINRTIAKATDIYNRKLAGTDVEDKETSYSDSFINALTRFVEFLRLNRNAVGTNLKSRLLVAQSASRETLQDLKKKAEAKASQPNPELPPIELPPIDTLEIPTSPDEAEIFGIELPYYSLEEIIQWAKVIDYKPRMPTTKEKVLKGIAEKLKKFYDVRVEWAL